jgi:hypothetical protein
LSIFQVVLEFSPKGRPAVIYVWNTSGVKETFKARLGQPASILLAHVCSSLRHENTLEYYFRDKSTGSKSK